MNISRIKRPRGSTPCVIAHRVMLGALCVIGTMLAPRGHAQAFHVSPDITTILAGTRFDDEDVAEDELSSIGSIDLGPLPAAADVVAYHREGSDAYFALATATALSGGVTADPRDVVVWDGTNYAIIFDGASSGVPAGARIDAVTLSGTTLLLSFDITVQLAGVLIGGVLIADEDLATAGGTFGLFFDASAAGISPRLDLDGASVLEDGRLAVSFDGSGVVDGIAFDDEDVLVTDSGTAWELLYDGSALDAGWRQADLDAVFVAPPPPLDVVFADGFESGNTSVWSTTVP